MSVLSGQPVGFLYEVYDPAIGQLANPTSISGALYINGVIDGTSVTPTNIATGEYRVSVTLPSLSVGDVVQIRLTYVFGPVTYKVLSWLGTVDPIPAALTTLVNAIKAKTDLVATNAMDSPNTVTEQGRIDTTVSSRSTYAGGDTSGITTLLSRLTGPRATLLDALALLDAAVSTRSTYAGGDTAGTTTLLARLTSTRAGLMDLLTALDAAISTRAAASVLGTPSGSTIADDIAAIPTTGGGGGGGRPMGMLSANFVNPILTATLICEE